MEDKPYINPNPDEPYFTRPLTPEEFLTEVQECGREVLAFTRTVSLRLQSWNITLDGEDQDARARHFINALSTLGISYAGYPRFTRQYSYLMMLAEMLATWNGIFEKYRQECDCQGCSFTQVDYKMCDELIKGLAAVEITGE